MQFKKKNNLFIITANQTLHELIRALKKLMARRGYPKTIYLEKAKTYAAASKLIKMIKIQRLLSPF